MFESRHAFLDLLDEPTKCFHLRLLEFLIDRLNSPAFLYRLAPCLRWQNAETKYVCIKLKSKVRLHFNLRDSGLWWGNDNDSWKLKEWFKWSLSRDRIWRCKLNVHWKQTHCSSFVNTVKPTERTTHSTRQRQTLDVLMCKREKGVNSLHKKITEGYNT